MKKFFLILLFVSNFNLSYADDNIVYIDINFILKNSIVGKSINNQIKNLQSAENEKFKTIEKKLIENEKKIISQKNILDEKQFKNEVVWNTIPLHAEERSMSQGLEQSDHTFQGLGRSSASNFQKYSKKVFFSSFSPRSSLLGDETEKENTRIENSSLSANSKVLGEKKAESLSTLGSNRKALGEKI